MENQNPTQGQVPAAPTGSMKPADATDDKHLLTAIGEAMAAVDAHTEKWAEADAAHEKGGSEEHTRLYDEATALENRASGLVWTALHQRSETLRGVQFKLAFAGYLKRTVDEETLAA